MDNSKYCLLESIVEEHIKTGAPVGSLYLVEHCDLAISSATVRQRMVELENDGYIYQPHTSAGRIPTEKAYKKYLEQNSKIPEINLHATPKVISSENDIKTAAKALAEITGLAIFWAFNRNNLYYTGVSNLLKQPEFARLNTLYDISEVIDKIDEITRTLYSQIQPGVHILIGSDNPFSPLCGTVIARCRKPKSGMVGIIGPMRMDYKKNIALMTQLFEKIK